MQKIVDSAITFLKKKDLRRIICSAVFALVFAVAYEYGALLTRGSGLTEEGLNLVNILMYFGIAFIATYYLLGIKRITDKVSRKEKNSVEKTYESRTFSKKRFIIVFLVIFLCYVPIFLAFYPGVFGYDVTVQIEANTTHHPLLHTVFLRFFTLIIGGQLFNNHNIGIALATITQMLIISAAFSYAIERMRLLKLPKTLYIAFILFFALCPTNAIMAISATKDTLFTAFLILSIVFFYDIVSQPDKHGVRRLLPFIITLVLACLFRNNMIYVAVIWLVFSFILLPCRKTILICAAIGILSVFAIQAVLKRVTDSYSGSAIEMFAVPVQILSRFAIDYPEAVVDFNTTEGLLLEGNSIDGVELAQVYNELLVDPVKSIWGEKVDNYSMLIKKTGKYVIKYPLGTIDIWGKLTASSWHIPNIDYTRVYGKSGYLQTGFIKLWDDSDRDSKLPWLQEQYDQLISNNGYLYNPVLSLIMAPAVYVWILFFLLLGGVYRKNHISICLILPMVLLFGTILVGPTIIIRYMYPIMDAVPVLFCLSYYAAGDCRHDVKLRKLR